MLQKTEEVGFIIGPVGGFTEDEKKWLSAHKNVTPISLGRQVLRAETAAIVCQAQRLCLSHNFSA